MRVVALAVLVILASVARADWRTDIGYDRLAATLGSDLPAAVSAGLLQAEAFDGDSNYAPDTADTNFTGKTFSLRSGTSGANGHAQGVASIFYGNISSLLPGATAVDLFSADGWIDTDFLRFGRNSQSPATSTRAVQNHSWISIDDDGQLADETQLARRLDFAINRDGFVCVVGVNNGQSTTLPELLCQAYNVVSVGLTNGNHSAGFTTYDGVGRFKPDLVAPHGLTSFATPMVASAAGVLTARLRASPFTLAGADLARVTKALLLTGTRKDTVASWANTPAQPLDLRYGAGELNVFHAYTTLLAGRTAASANATVPARGWAAESVAANASVTYFFDIPAPAAGEANFTGSPFTATLVWHRIVTPGSGQQAWSNPSSAVADLTLRLHAANGFTVGNALAASASPVDNVEHLHLPALAPGRYALVVSAADLGATYALAWRTLPVVAVVATQPDARESGLVPALVTVTRTGDTTSPLLVPLMFGGDATAGVDYATPPASVTIPAGASSATVTVTPLANPLAQGDHRLTVSAADDFTFQSPPAANTATVTLHDAPFDLWRRSGFSTEQLADPTVSAATADPDRDGRANLLEFAEATLPLAADTAGRPATLALENARLVLRFFKPAGRDDLVFTPQLSTDLATWVALPEGTTVSPASDDSGETVTAVLPASWTAFPQVFLRLEVIAR